MSYVSSNMSPCMTCQYDCNGCHFPGGEFNGRISTDKSGCITHRSNYAANYRPMVKRKRMVKSVYDFDVIQSYKTLRHV